MLKEAYSGNTHVGVARRGNHAHGGTWPSAKAAGGITLALTSSVLEETQGLLGSPEENIARIPSVERNGEQAKTPEQNLAPAS